MSSSSPVSFKAQWWTTEVEQALYEEKEARKRWIRTRNDYDKELLLEKARIKSRTIRTTKRKQWRDFVHEASTSQNLWKLAKWGKGASRELPIMPPLLRLNDSIGVSAKDKTDILFDRFYTPVTADLSDIQEAFPPIFTPSLDTSLSFTLPDSTLLPVSSTSSVSPLSVLSLSPLSSSFYPVLPYDYNISYEEVRQALKERKSYSCPGLDTFSYAFLKALGPPFINILVSIISTSWRLGYFPSRYKQARTIVIRKPNKGDYSQAKAWRHIALLATIGKLIEKVTANKIKEVTEQFSLLPAEQMGFRSNRSTETALDLLVSQIQEVQKSKSHVATLLSFDISGAFDSVVPERLVDILRRKGFPLWLLSFIASFSACRSTTIILPSGEESELRDIGHGLPQGSPLSVILFILYNSSLFDIFRRYKIGISSIGFADDLNALAYSTSTEQNCRQLEALHLEALKWAKKHGITFAPDKYELIHFSRARTRFNLQASIQLSEQVTKEPAKEVRVLGVWLDSKLSWGPHIRKVYDKGLQQLGALTSISSSTWGVTFLKSRQVYLSVVRPAFTYASSIWAPLPSLPSPTPSLSIPKTTLKKT